MTGYIIRRLIQMVFVVLAVAVATYFLFSIAPGGPLTGLRQSQQRLKDTDIARIRAQYELDLYWPVRFTRWLAGFPQGPIVIAGNELFATVPVGCYLPDAETGGCQDYVYLSELPQLHPPIRSSQGVLRGDFGLSSVVSIGRPAMDLFRSRIGPTLELMVSALLLSLLIGIPIGIYSAVRQYSKFDYLATTISFVGSAMPTFFFGLIMILLFSIVPVLISEQAPWLIRLPPGLRTAIRPYEIASWLPQIQPKSPADRFLHILMPLFVLTFFNTAQWSRFVRSSMLEVLRQDYVRTARAKGLFERAVIIKHALRNALIPFVTILVLQIPSLFAGATITETVFAWPGIGSLYVDALNRSDWPVALAFIFITAVLTVIATLLGDILYTVVDPRIRYS
jgi:peptide/nickel transport system permease protein